MHEVRGPADARSRLCSLPNLRHDPCSQGDDLLGLRVPGAHEVRSVPWDGERTDRGPTTDDAWLLHVPLLLPASPQRRTGIKDGRLPESSTPSHRGRGSRLWARVPHARNSLANSACHIVEATASTPSPSPQMQRP